MKIVHRFTRFTFATGAATALLFGCGSSSPSNATSQIAIECSAFSVAGDVKSTDVVSVTNRDGFKHTVTADDGVFDVTVEGGATVILPSLNPGTYAFHCKIHTSMRGTLTVG